MPVPAPFTNPVWHALHGPHRHLGHRTNLACRYQPDISPFAAVAKPTPAAFTQLATLLTPGESIWLIEPDPPSTPSLITQAILPGLQMLLPADAPLPPPPTQPVLQLTAHDLPDMLALIALAFPGFFLPGTPRMGSWFGIRVAGMLVAMAGERFLPTRAWPEISGLCTHPAHRGHGHAATLLAHLTHRHRAHGQHSWLEVGTANTRAIALYQQLGFQTFVEVTFQHLRRIA